MHKNGLALEGFTPDPDLDEVAELMTGTWAHPCWNYTGNMLAAYEQRPGVGPTLSLGYRCEGELAGYMAYMPCPVQHAGQHYRMLFASFWTAMSKYGLQGIPLKLHAALHSKACVDRYQGLLTIGEEDSKGLKAFELVSQRLELPFRTLARFGMLMGTPHLARNRLPAAFDERHVRHYAPRWREQCAWLIAETGRKQSLARLFGVAEVGFLLGTREGSRTWLWLDGARVRGIFSGWSQRVLGLRPFEAFQVDHVLLDGLEPREQRAFLGAVFADPCWDAIEAIHVPLCGPVSEELFRQAGFMKTSKTFQLNYLPLRDGPALEKIDSVYLEFY